jgi:hypothetical protein
VETEHPSAPEGVGEIAQGRIDETRVFGSLIRGWQKRRDHSPLREGFRFGSDVVSVSAGNLREPSAEAALLQEDFKKKSLQSYGVRLRR